MAIYFDDTFTGTLNTTLTSHTPAVGTGYTQIAGSAGTADNVLTGDGRIMKRSTSGAVKTNTIAVADYQVDCIIDILTLLASDNVTFWARLTGTDVNNAYSVVLDQSGALLVRKTVASVNTTLMTLTLTLAGATTRTLSLRLVGSTLTLLVDGVNAVAVTGSNPVTDTALSAAGSSGIRQGSAATTAPSVTTGMLPTRLTVTDPPLRGTVNATSALTGALSVTNDNALAGTVAAAATLTGAVTVGVSIAGTIAATCTLTGAATVAKPVAGTIASTVTLTGALTNTPATVNALAGTISCTSALIAALSVDSTSTSADLAGTIAATSTVSGDLEAFAPATAGTRFAVHWFWEPGNQADDTQPAIPDTCPECGSSVAVMGRDAEVITRHYAQGATKTDGTEAQTDCPYIATINTSNYAQPLPADITAGYVTV